MQVKFQNWTFGLRKGLQWLQNVRLYKRTYPNSKMEMMQVSKIFGINIVNHADFYYSSSYMFVIFINANTNK